MSRFPQTEAEVIALAHAIVTGLNAHPDEFPTPPIKPEALQTLLNEFLVCSDEATSSQARAVEATSHKKSSLQKLTDAMRQIVQYSEHATTSDKWSLIGWSARANPVPLQAPGQVRNLILAKKGIDWITLEWNAPAEGGNPAVYHVQSREAPEGAWGIMTTAFEKEITLSNISSGKSMEFKIEAANKQGIGSASNSVLVNL